MMGMTFDMECCLMAIKPSSLPAPANSEDQQVAIYLQIDKLKALCRMSLQAEIMLDAASSGDRQCMILVIEDLLGELERLFDGYCGE